MQNPGVMMIPAVSHFMSTPPCTIERRATLAHAHQIMRSHHIRHLPVIEAGAPCGIVTETGLQLYETLVEADPETTLVEEAMQEKPFVVTSDMPLDEVLEIMAEQKYGSVIVAGRDGVEGMFTFVDACHAFAKMLQAQQTAVD